MTIEKLTDILLGLPEHESRAVRVLRQQRQITGELYPHIESKVERVRLVDDLVATSNAAARLGEAVCELRPIPVKAIHNDDIEAWCLL